MRCLHCGYENTPDALFCEKCGNSLANSGQGDSFFCPECGTENKADALFCEGCGRRLVKQVSGGSVPEKSSKPWLIIGILAAFIVCLGVGGFIVYRVYDSKRSEIAEDLEAAKSREAKADKKEPDTEKEETEKKEKEKAEKEETEEDTKEEDKTAEETEAAPGEASEPEQQAPAQQTQPVQAPAVTMQNVSGVSATSELAEATVVHSASRIMDGDKNTAWVEGADGQGYGQSVRFDFNNVYLVSGIRIRAGYHKNDDIYYKNSRPKEICAEYSDGTSEIFRLEDAGQIEQILMLPYPVETSMVNLTIESVYPGGKYEDTCISEVSFF